MARLRVLTWHIHGSYLYYLTQTPVDFYILSKPDRSGGYLGRYGHFPWGDNVHDMAAAEVKDHKFDCVLFQSQMHYLHDQYEILSAAQRKLPCIFLEHDPPRMDPTGTRHAVDDPDMFLVHVTHFNNLMWDSGDTPTRVIPHGVQVPENVRYSGELDRGIVVINHLARRGRRLGNDVYLKLRLRLPFDLVGMGSEETLGGLGEVQYNRLAEFESHYRFFFNPIRYTSLGLAVCEAMMVGMPIVGLATTEMVTTVENGISGYVSTDVEQLVDVMQELLDSPDEAKRLGANARDAAMALFHIDRFKRDWLEVFSEAVSRGSV